MDLWTTQRSVAHKLHNANSSSKRKRTNDVLSKPDKSECYRHLVGLGSCLRLRGDNDPEHSGRRCMGQFWS